MDKAERGVVFPCSKKRFLQGKHSMCVLLGAKDVVRGVAAGWRSLKNARMNNVQNGHSGHHPGQKSFNGHPRNLVPTIGVATYGQREGSRWRKITLWDGKSVTWLPDQSNGLSTHLFPPTVVDLRKHLLCYQGLLRLMLEGRLNGKEILENPGGQY